MKLLSTKCTLIFLLLFISFKSVAQPCIPYPGYTTWLGYTDVWQDSANWCPAIAPVSTNPAMNVRIPGGPSGPYTYYRPVIRPGVYALTDKLRVEANDSIFIQAANQSSLIINDSLKIQNATSAIVVNVPIIDSIQVSTDSINIPSDSPLNHYNRSRSFVVIPQSELLAQGMQTGDVICRILFHIKRNSNGSPYRNCTIKYYYTTNASGIFGTGYAANIPIPVGVPSVPATIWTGNLYSSTYIPGINDYGTVDLELQTPIPWSGSINPLCIEICYDNSGFPGTGFNDEPRYTQTGNLNRYLSIQAVTNFINPGCSLMAQDTIVVNGSWTAGTNTITLASSASVLNGMYVYPGGQTVTGIFGNVIALDSVLTTSGTNSNLVLSNVRVVSSPFRPNMTFVVGCDSVAKYPIHVRGHWENNGTFIAGNSRVTFDGTINDQQIGGQSMTTFYDLNISNSNHVIRLQDFTVEDTLFLLNGRLKLNLGMVTLLNHNPGAISRMNGYIQAETDQLINNVYPFGRVYWKMGNSTGTRYLPFINTAGQSIFLDYQIISGSHDVVIGTYGTNPNNTNLPLPEVTNVIGYSNGSYNSSGDNVVDRFYLLKDSLGINPVAFVKFRYGYFERAVSGFTGMCAQQWINSLDVWANPLLPGQTFTPGGGALADMVSLIITDSVFSTSDWWNISSCSQPLGTGLSEINPAFISAYPNPAFPGDELNLELNGNSFQPELIRIYSIDGREVVQEKFGQMNSTFQIPESFSPGIYTVEFTSRKKRGIMKLVILKQ